MIRIGHLTDIHVANWSSFGARHVPTKRVTGYLNHQLLRRSHHRIEVLFEAVAALVDVRPDHVVVSGDLTNTGMPSEYSSAVKALRPLRDAGVSVSVVPGNHDRYVRVREDESFEACLGEYLVAERRPSGRHFPYVVRRGGVSILHLDSALPTPPFMAYGRVGERQLAHFDELALAERENGQALMVVVHHHPRHFRHRRAEWSRNLRGAGALREACLRHGVDIVVHGHNHFQQVARFGGAHGPVLCGLSSSSIGEAWPPERVGAVGLYEFDDEGLHSLHFSRYDGNNESFGPFESQLSAEVPDEPPEDAPLA